MGSAKGHASGEEGGGAAGGCGWGLAKTPSSWAPQCAFGQAIEVKGGTADADEGGRLWFPGDCKQVVMSFPYTLPG